jgi:hypothetical protein
MAWTYTITYMQERYSLLITLHEKNLLLKCMLIISFNTRTLVLFINGASMHRKFLWLILLLYFPYPTIQQNVNNIHRPSAGKVKSSYSCFIYLVTYNSFIDHNNNICGVKCLYNYNNYSITVA